MREHKKSSKSNTKIDYFEERVIIMSEYKFTNKLINEKSPYLLQHAHNPVDWYPWGQEAFYKAKTENKPIFLSIGYSTCHWCHVMERESFEDTEVAEALNRNFIAIKVDREERPDIDSVYMAVCQALTGSGGWPMTIVMTPEQKPFFAATYLPKTTRYGTMGMMELLSAIAQQWKTNPTRLTKSGEEISDFMRKQAEIAANSEKPTKDMLRQTVEMFSNSFDKSYGGFGVAPKFPTPHNLLFLLRYSVLDQDGTPQTMAEKTLEQLYRGGIFDHIGGGFSRYSTDEKWLVPHFEKMLYDNALLSYTYLEAYEMTNRTLYRTVAEKTLNYVLNELTDQTGGFYCGQDADSDGVEGKYYVFTQDEIRSVLGQADSEVFCRWFGISEKGNFEGKNIINLLKNDHLDQPNPQIDELCQKLYDYRLQRTKLHKDDKILTSWNGLMIAALAKAYCVLDNPRYLQAAQKAQQFISDKLTDENKRLFIRWRDGNAAGLGQLDDYAFYAWSLLELYQATFEVRYLQESSFIAEHMMALFFDEKIGGFYLYAADSEQLISRPKELYDGAMPSGNAVAAMVLERLSKLTGEIKWQEWSDKQLQFLAGNITGYPVGHSFSLLAMMEALYPSKELICATADTDTKETLHKIQNETYKPNVTVLVKTQSNNKALAEIAPFTADYEVPGEGTTYYLCQNGTCSTPISESEKLKEMLRV